jgi:hypothetical protein
VHDRVVAEDASLANDRGVAGVGVEHAAVLHVGPSFDPPANGQALSLLTPQEDTKRERRKRLSALGR